MTQLPSNWTLYISPTCPFCKRVTDFLAEKNIAIAVVNAWENDDTIHALKEMAGRRTVPYLRMGDAGMHESLDIINRIAQEAGADV